MSDMEGMMPELTLNADAAKVEMPSKIGRAHV